MLFKNVRVSTSTLGNFLTAIAANQNRFPLKIVEIKGDQSNVTLDLGLDVANGSLTELTIPREEIDAVFDLLGIFPRQKPQIDWPKEAEVSLALIQERLGEMMIITGDMISSETLRSIGLNLRSKIGSIRSMVNGMQSWGK